MKYVKKLLKRCRFLYARIPMRNKLFLSYFLPVLLICTAIAVWATPLLRLDYQKQLDRITNQSFAQAENFVEQYVSNMYYVKELLTAREDLNDILKSEDFFLSLNGGEHFRQFWGLTTAIQETEAANNGVRIGLYVPDELTEIMNRTYFFPMSEIQNLEGWDSFGEDLMKERFVFFRMMDKDRGNETHMVPCLTMLSWHTVLAENGETRNYIVKIQLLDSMFENVLRNAMITDSSFLYLCRGDGEVLACTDWERLPALMTGTDFPTDTFRSWKQLWLDGRSYYGVCADIYMTSWQLVMLIPQSEFTQQSFMMAFMLIALMILICLAVLLVSRIISNYYGRRLTVLNQRLKEVEHGNVHAVIDISPEEEKQTADEIDQIYASFNLMTAEIQQLLKEHYRLGKEVMSAEVKVLQAQINPHFLYNTLDLINWGALDYGAEDVAKIARDLGQFYRLSLNHGQSIISIRNELRHVQAYIDIENVHFDGRIHVTVDVPEEIRELGCMNIILQPFVENAIIHGIAEHPEIPECNIRISACSREEYVEFCIADDGPGIPEWKIPLILESEGSDQKHGYGVKNINFRLKLSFGDRFGVSYKSREGEGTEVYVRVPKATCEELAEMM